jgi:tripartite-type tricarboxylate transporter receptor subunit TctC
VPANTFQEFVELAKKSPGKYTVAASVPSNGMWAKWVMKRLGAEVTIVDYKSAPQSVQDVIGGHVLSVANTFSGYEAFLRDGRLRGLVAVTEVRNPDFPNLPPITDFAPGTAYDSWLGIISPKGVPDPIVQRLNRLTDTLVREPEFAKRALAAGWSNRHGARTPKEIADLNKVYRDKWGEIVREAGVQPQ